MQCLNVPQSRVQLPGIVRMFASEMTVASAWIHLLAVDLFAARLAIFLHFHLYAHECPHASRKIVNVCVLDWWCRQVYHDGIKNNIETRHSISLCLLFCPVGIAAHALTKVLAGSVGRSHWRLKVLCRVPLFRWWIYCVWFSKIWINWFDAPFVPDWLVSAILLEWLEQLNLTYPQGFLVG
jgi:hypothetical protein